MLAGVRGCVIGRRRLENLAIHELHRRLCTIPSRSLPVHRRELFDLAKKQHSLSKPVTKIVIRVRVGSDREDIPLLMTAHCSTVLDCARHVSARTARDVALALELDEKEEIRRVLDPGSVLTADSRLQLLALDEPSPHAPLVHQAFWHSCAFLLGAVVESALDRSVALLPLPDIPYNHGYFACDVRVSGLSDSWRASQAELEGLTRCAQRECIDGKLAFEQVAMPGDVAHLCFPGNRLGGHVDVSPGTVIARSDQIGHFAVTHCSAIAKGVFRLRGVALPEGARVSSHTWHLLVRSSTFSTEDRVANTVRTAQAKAA